MYIQEREEFLTSDGLIVETDDGRVPWWYSRKAQIIKWAVFTGLFFAFLLYLVVGHYHAVRRLKKNKAPLKYHRWMLNREQRAIHEPEFRNPVPQYGVYRPQYGVYRPGDYNMQNFPPPRYDPSQPPPPTYQPPEGASKVAPSQYHSEPTRRPPSGSGDEAPDYEAPPGPPPAAVTANHTAGSGSEAYRV